MEELQKDTRKLWGEDYARYTDCDNGFDRIIGMSEFVKF